ncbi:hypothetical protein HMPREF3197_04976 [Klebsiella pneumoniae]|nr:hypothetical protein HMPREF3197_04976 [Klebsiella pneumoniae]
MEIKFILHKIKYNKTIILIYIDIILSLLPLLCRHHGYHHLTVQLLLYKTILSLQCLTDMSRCLFPGY